MSKKILSLILACAMVLCVFSFAGCGENPAGDSAKKIGVVLIGDENEGYTYAHIDGIKKAAEKLGVKEDQIIWKYTVGENEGCYDACAELADGGCGLVITNSYGHQSYAKQAAEEFPDTQFVSMTGDMAATSGLSNYHNAFTKVYESRYISGVVAGCKIKELVEAGKLTDANYDENGNVLVGYVGAFPFAEVISGYTAFYLGIKSVYENVSMKVQFTQSWFDITAEGATAEALLSQGCVIICQHADSTGAPSAVQAAYKSGKVCYSVGYNIDMLNVAPDVALTSATNNWSVYYEYLLDAYLNGKEIKTDWAEGYAADAVAITKLGPACAAGTQEAVDAAIAGLKDGSVHVFDTSKFTVNGEHLTSCVVDLTGDFDTDDEGDKEAIWDGYFHESELRSAPSFALEIDGIEKLQK